MGDRRPGSPGRGGGHDALLHGRYLIQSAVEEGPDGAVHRAVDQVHGRQVALVSIAIGADETAGAAPERVRRLLGLPAHPNLPTVRDSFDAEGRHHWVTDWIEGPSLAAVVAGAPTPPSFEQVLGWLDDVAAALEHLHGRLPPVVHGFVRPENLVVAADGRIVVVERALRATAGPGSRPAPGRHPESGVQPPAEGPAEDVRALAATARRLLGSTGDGRVDEALAAALDDDPERRPSAARLVAQLRAAHWPTNIRTRTTSFVGREEALREIEALLSAHRQVTLSGPGGSGKTRLALEVAQRLLPEYPGGVWVIELATVTDAALVATTVARPFGVRDVDDHGLILRMSAHIGGSRTLLVLDNCEHLLEPTASVVSELLARCPELRVLVTSRQRLHLASDELVWTVPPLSLPGEVAGEPADPEAVRLFWERAGGAPAAAARGGADQVLVEYVVRGLDGLPLAIELAASHVASLGLPEVARRLGERLRLRGSGPDTVRPLRHHTLQATLDWSHELLTVGERVLFRRLAIFAGGFALDVAERVIPDGDVAEADVLELVTGLVEKSLLTGERHGREHRFSMLETVREYALARLAEAGEVAELAARHRAWCVELVAEAGRGMAGPEQARWLAVLDREHDNIRAALAGGLSSGDAESVVRITGGIWRYWEIRGHITEGRTWLEQALAMSEDVAPALRLEALNGAGNLAHMHGALEAAGGFHNEGLALAGGMNQPVLMARALSNLGNVDMNRHDFARARERYEESARLCEGTPAVAIPLLNLAEVARLMGDHAAARAALEISTGLLQESGDGHRLAEAMLELGDLELAVRRPEPAGDAYRTGLRLSSEGGFRRVMAEALLGLGLVASARARPQLAARLLGAAEALRAAIGSDFEVVDVARHEGVVASLRSALGDRFGEEWECGRTRPVEDSVTEALAE